jgi:hypothetical protein
VGPKTGLDDVEKRKILPLPGPELRHLSRPARSQSLYRLRYPGSYGLRGGLYLFFLVVYFTMLYLGYVAFNGGMIDEFEEKIVRQVVVYSVYYPGICLEGVRKIMKNLRETCVPSEI